VRRYAGAVTILLVVVVGFIFGAIDQYLGTGHVTSRLGWWTITVSGMSAPWLILPFLVGMTHDRARKAAALGLAVTMAALLGYFYMSNSAFESVPLDRLLPRMLAMMRGDYNVLWISGGLLCGPLYGYLGHRWRVARSWVAATAAATALCLEPLGRFYARGLLGGLTGSPVVWTVEVGVGIVGAAFFVVLIKAHRRFEHENAVS
jgi:Family of unknown function (DUF6518)